MLFDEVSDDGLVSEASSTPLVVVSIGGGIEPRGFCSNIISYIE